MGMLVLPQKQLIQPQYAADFVLGKNPKACFIGSISTDLINKKARTGDELLNAIRPCGKVRVAVDRYSSDSYPVNVPTLTDFTLFAYVSYVDCLDAFQYLLGFSGPGDNLLGIPAAHSNISGHWGLSVIVSNVATFIDSTEVLPQNKLSALVITRSGSTIKLYRDGILKNVASNSSTIAPQTNLTLNSYEVDSGFGAHTGTYFALAGIDSTAWVDTEVNKFSANPWQLFKAPARRLYVVSSGGSLQNLEPLSAEAIAGIDNGSFSAGSVSISATAPSSTAAAPVPVLTAGAVSILPLPAGATAVVESPSLNNGAIDIQPAAAVASASVDTPSLTAGSVNVVLSAAIASAAIPVVELTSDSSVLTPQAAISTAGAGSGILTAGETSLAPTAAAAIASAENASFTNGSQLTPSAAIASAAASDPALTAGGVDVPTVAAIASASAGSSVLSAGAVQIIAVSASASAVASDPALTSGKMLAIDAAMATAAAGAASFVAGLVSLASSGAGATAVALQPSLSAGAMSLLPVSAFAVATLGDSYLVDGGMQWSAEMLHVIPSEDRTYTIAAEDRAYSVPTV